MIEDVKKDAQERMSKSVDVLGVNFKKIRTGRAHPSILDSIHIPYYGSDVPLSQVANVSVVDARMLAITHWEKHIVPDIERAIMKADLGLNPSTAGEVIRVPMPALTEQTRKGFIKQARSEAEHARVSIRNVRRDANGTLKDLVKGKVISEDDERKAQDDIQKITDKHIAEVDAQLAAKEKDLMEI